MSSKVAPEFVPPPPPLSENRLQVPVPTSMPRSPSREDLRKAAVVQIKSDKSGAPEVTVHTVSRNSRAPGSKPGRRTMINGIEQAPLNPALARARKILRPLSSSRVFKGCQVLALAFALFGGNLWSICNVNDSPGLTVLDTLMLLVTAFFFGEIALLCIIQYREYPLSSFFFMDILGTLSMAFEVSFLLGAVASENTGNMNSTFLRALRATKVAARAGRLSKVLKCLSVAHLYLTSRQEHREEKEQREAHENGVQAKVLSSKLMMTLSTKVSILTVILVLIVPLFGIGQYPEEDMSMSAWAQRLEDEYGRAYLSLAGSNASSTDAFQTAVKKLQDFYVGVSYVPYRMDGFPERVVIGNRTVFIPGASLLGGQDPNRRTNKAVRPVASCSVQRPGCSGDQTASVFWDFTKATQAGAGSDVAMVVFIIFVMAAASANFTGTLNTLFVEPVEQILTMVKTKAATILKDLGEGLGEDDEDDDQTQKKNETEMLESIFNKLARLASLSASRNIASEEDMEGLDNEGKAVMMDMMHLEVRRPTNTLAVMKDRAFMDPGDVREDDTFPDGTASCGVLPAAVGILPVSKAKIESWDLDLLELEADARKKIVLYIFFDSQLGSATGRMWTTLDTLSRFHNKVKVGYNEAPYHNYPHACDVLHTVFRLVCTSLADRWLADIDQHALLTAALCHDLGHQGYTNPFLVETKHDLALRYNDKSPLENMHCARLFEICSEPQNNVFEKAGKEDHKQARKVCIATILHTDLVNHVDMVRDISRIYEINSEACEAQAHEPDEILQQYEEQVLLKEPLLWLELFLHLADVSNPLKPFPICKAWAFRILDEFFAQGDKEKELGLPVGMLNDRDKTNRPGSQHGFIVFLVSPLVVSSVNLFPKMHTLSAQMASNLGSWRDMWVEDVKPSAEDVAKRDAEVKKFMDLAARLTARCQMG